MDHIKYGPTQLTAILPSGDKIECEVKDFQLDCSNDYYGDNYIFGDCHINKPKTYTITGTFDRMTYTKMAQAAFGNNMNYLTGGVYRSPTYDGSVMVGTNDVKGKVDMTDSAAIRREVLKLLEVADHLDSRPEDDFKKGAIVVFKKDFKGDKEYTYVAVKIGNDAWWLSSSATTNYGVVWERVLEIAEENGGTVDGLWYVNDMKAINYK